MPSKSAKQRKFMAAAANNPAFAKKAGIPQSVAKEYHAADRKGYQFGGLAAVAPQAIEKLMAQSGDEEAQKAALLALSQKFGNIPVNPETGGRGMFGRMFHNIGQEAGRRLSEMEPVGTYGGAGRTGNYYVPQSRRTGMDFDPGSIADEIYQKYGIIDPTWTDYDRTNRELMKEDPYAHMAPDDPARQEYQRWDLQRGHRFDQAPEAGPIYAEMAGKESPYREQLRQHKATVADILGSAEGGRVNYQAGGLARAAMMRPGMMRGRMGRRMRGAPPMSRRAQPMKRLAPPRGNRIGFPQRGQVQAGGPGGPMGGAEMIGLARMPGGRAAPFRGLLQKMQSMRQQGQMPGRRKQVGLGDQQGGLNRAMQTQTGRPPISRRAAFPGSRQNQY